MPFVATIFINLIQKTLEILHFGTPSARPHYLIRLNCCQMVVACIRSNPFCSCMHHMCELRCWRFTSSLIQLKWISTEQVISVSVGFDFESFFSCGFVPMNPSDWIHRESLFTKESLVSYFTNSPKLLHETHGMKLRKKNAVCDIVCALRREMWAMPVAWPYWRVSTQPVERSQTLCW